jgi:hypothetical protein
MCPFLLSKSESNMKIAVFTIIAIYPSVLALLNVCRRVIPNSAWVNQEPTIFYGGVGERWYVNFPPESGERWHTNCPLDSLPGDSWHGADFPQEDNAPQDLSATEIEVTVGELRFSNCQEAPTFISQAI